MRHDVAVPGFASLPPAARTGGGLRRIARDPRVLLGGVVLLAVACRLAGAGHRLVLDEGYTWLVGSAPTAHLFLERLASFENTPPLFYLLLTPFSLDREVWVRLPAIVAGAAAIPVLYAIVRPLAGPRAALLAALTLAVAPYQVATADLARGFTLATLGLLIAVWGIVRLVEDGSGRWWSAYAAGAVIAIWSEYYAVLTLIPLVLTLLALRTRPPREVLLLGAAPLATMIPWAWQLKRSLDLDAVTKVLPQTHGIGFGVVRDELVPLFFGEHGEAAAGRTVELVVLAGALGTAAWLLGSNHRVLRLLGGVAGGTLILHAAAATAGPGVFERRYLSVLVPLVVALLSAGLVRVRARALVPLASAVLLLVGGGVIVKRARSDPEPDYRAAGLLVARAHVGRVLTNSPVVAYYLGRLVALDRPFDLGAGREHLTPPPYAVVDDGEVGSGVRPGPGPLSTLGRITIRLVTAPRQTDGQASGRRGGSPRITASSARP